jgi:adenylyltransferase/sulfurtransferase
MPDELFVIDESDRYSRLQLIGWWDQRRLAAARILVVGAGALGNEVLKNLALVGVGAIDLIDLDRIENSNLSRSVLFREQDAGQPKAMVAAARTRELNPAVAMRPIHGNVMTAIGLGVVRAADVVIGCLDNREARLWVNRMCWKVGTPWIDGGIQEINGVVKVFLPPDGPCYECGMTETDYRLINLRYSCPLLKQSDLQQGKVPTAPTIASIIGAMQVQEALKLLHGLPMGDATATIFNGAANRMYQTRYPIRPDCLSHETYEPIRDSHRTHEVTLGEFLSDIESELQDSGAEIVLDRDWVTHLRCGACQMDRDVGVTQFECDQAMARCTRCGQLMTPNMVHRIGRDHPLAPKRLAELGIPDFDIVKVETAGQVSYYQLRPSADADA